MLLRCRYGALQDVEEAIRRKVSELPKDPMLTEEVGPEDIAQVVSRWTGIHVTKLAQTDRERLLRLAEDLHVRVVGGYPRHRALCSKVMRSQTDNDCSESYTIRTQC